MGASTIAAFVLASTILLVVPGPAVTYVIARSVQDGRRVGLASVVGLHIGTGVHIAAAALGLSALLVSSAEAYTALRWAGAAYLIYLGVRSLRSGDAAMAGTGAESVGAGRALRDGIFVNVLNPKLAVFFLAYLPQFTDPGAGSVATQLLILGGVFIAVGFVTDGLYAVAADAAGRKLGQASAVLRHRDRIAGAVYLGLGALALVAPGRRT
ncbi:MAG TPA: LysE family translocator [Acidimicrobiia bacterium]|jgi:threonine/homoserine/homoserine lactone efflux protein|nr:LysE family translocator [Acidimicrobiia bacterium]